MNIIKIINNIIMGDIINATRNKIFNLFDSSPQQISLTRSNYANILLGLVALIGKSASTRNNYVSKSYNIYALWNLDRYQITNVLQSVKLLFQTTDKDVVLNNESCRFNLIYSVEWFLNYCGWEIIDDQVFRIEKIEMDWVRNSQIIEIINNIFECLNYMELYNCSKLLFLCMCKTSSVYLSSNKNSASSLSVGINKYSLITPDVFKKWLNYQSFWIPKSVIVNYNINLKLHKDIRMFLTDSESDYKLIIEKGDREQREPIIKLFYDNFLRVERDREKRDRAERDRAERDREKRDRVDVNKGELNYNDFLNQIESLDPKLRTDYMYEVYKNQNK